MIPKDWYEAWRQRRGREEPPPGFADRVMAAIAAGATPRSLTRRSRAGALVIALWSSRLGRIAVFSLSAAACLFRLGHVVAIFVVQ